MRDGEMEGMQTFDQVLERNVREGTLNYQTAMEYATNRNNLALQLRDWEEARRKGVSEQPVAVNETAPVAPAATPPPPQNNSILSQIEKF